MRSFLLSGVFTSYDREVRSCHPLTLDLQSSSNVKFHNNQKGKFRRLTAKQMNLYEALPSKEL